MTSSSELSTLLAWPICSILGTTARNPKMRMSAPSDVWKSPGLVGFITLFVHLLTFLALKARHFSGKQDTKWSMNLVPKILQAILLLTRTKYVPNLLLSLKPKGDLVSACTCRSLSQTILICINSIQKRLKWCGVWLYVKPMWSLSMSSFEPHDAVWDHIWFWDCFFVACV